MDAAQSVDGGGKTRSTSPAAFAPRRAATASTRAAPAAQFGSSSISSQASGDRVRAATLPQCGFEPRRAARRARGGVPRRASDGERAVVRRRRRRCRTRRRRVALHHVRQASRQRPLPMPAREPIGIAERAALQRFRATAAEAPARVSSERLAFSMIATYSSSSRGHPRGEIRGRSRMLVDEREAEVAPGTRDDGHALPECLERRRRA